jgi:hypothetical protein
MDPNRPLAWRTAALRACFPVLLAAASWLGPGGEPSEMVAAARALLGALTEGQRAEALLSFDGAERTDWRFVPGDRGGVAIGALDTSARAKLAGLLACALSERGIGKVEGVIALEGVLRELEGPHRDPGRYFLAVWGVPGDEKPWGWRLEGHHLSLSVTAAGAGVIVATPFFAGANPARVASGERAGFRLLGADDDAARAFAAELSPELRERARIAGALPADVSIGPGQPAVFASGVGIAAGELDEAARGELAALAERAVRDLRPDHAEAELARLRAAPAESITFAWAGSPEPGEAFDWRVTWGSLAFEFTALSGDPGHVHSVWRDRERDFGAALLAPRER